MKDEKPSIPQKVIALVLPIFLVVFASYVIKSPSKAFHELLGGKYEQELPPAH